MSEFIERAAKAAWEKERQVWRMWDSWEELSDIARTGRIEAQRAALESMLEPTEEMLKCSEQLAWSEQFAGDKEEEREYGKYLWQLMIVAALSESTDVNVDLDAMWRTIVAAALNKL